MRPLNDYVVVERVENASDDQNLIVLSEDAKEKQPIGRVIAAGPGRFVPEHILAESLHQIGALMAETLSNGDTVTRQRISPRLPMAVRPGDIVLFYAAASQKIKVKGKEYYVMSETNIFLILDPEGEKDE